MRNLGSERMVLITGSLWFRLGASSTPTEAVPVLGTESVLTLRFARTKQDGILHASEVASLEIDLAGDGLEKNRLGLSLKIINYRIDIRELIPGSINLPVIRVPFQDEAFGGRRDFDGPGEYGRQVRVHEKTVLNV